MMPLARKLVRLAFVCLAALGFLLLVVTFTPVVPWYARILAREWGDAKGDTMIVLAGGVIDAETLAPGSYWRCVYADRVWRGGGFRDVVVSGAAIAPLMRDMLVFRGIPAAAIRVENASHSTRENALYTAKLLAETPGRKVLVTSDYHTFRALRAFRKAGLAVESRPFPDVIKTSMHLTGRWDGFVTEVMETTKIAYYWVRGWI
jgi:uncharacterized SAM-binding protein YcdF (DUF218 family)